MKRSEPSQKPSLLDQAFSLVEVVLALGIVTFAIMALFGMLGVGLKTFRESVNSTVQANIIQRIVNEAQIKSYDPAYSTNLSFDYEGLVVPAGDPDAIYVATVSPTNFSLPSGMNATFQVDRPSVATQLQVRIINKTDPTKTNQFTLVWPKQ